MKVRAFHQTGLFCVKRHIRHKTHIGSPDGKYGGIGADIFDRISETMFTRYVLGLKVLSSEPGVLSVRMPFNPMLAGSEARPAVHTGAIATLIDHCGGICSWTLLTKPSQLVSTVDLRIDYLAEAPCNQDIICDAVVVNSGDKFIHTNITCWNSDRTVKLSVGRGLYNIYLSPFAKKLDIGGWFETVAFKLPSSSTAAIVALIERMAVWKLKYFPRRKIPHSKFSHHHLPTDHALKHRSLPHRHSHPRPHSHVHGVSEVSSSSHLLSDPPVSPLGATVGELPVTSFVSAAETDNVFIREVFRLRVLSVGPNHVTTCLPFKKRFIGNFFIPCLHGGVTAAVIEYSGLICARSVCDLNTSFISTVNVNVSYLKPAPCEDMLCDAVVSHLGQGGMVYVHVVCWNSSRKIKVAAGSALYRIKPMKSTDCRENLVPISDELDGVHIV